MSQITVENIKRASETVARSTRGVAAAWVNFDGTGTIAARDSENVSSLTDNGTGDYTVNWTNAFGAADYAVLSRCEYIAGTTLFTHHNPSTPPVAGSVRFFTGGSGLSGGVDTTAVWLSTYGDLA